MGVVAANQLGFDLGGDAGPSYAPDVDGVRVELQEILAMVRGANSTLPWDGRTFLYYCTVFPQMVRWLPAAERDQLCTDFEREAERIGTPLAA